jgi:apolipoprotein N-acyltransferase
MSLKAFHLVFITASSALAAGCGIWWLSEFLSSRSGILGLISSFLAIGVAVALILYERYFLKKLKNVH